MRTRARRARTTSASALCSFASPPEADLRFGAFSAVWMTVSTIVSIAGWEPPAPSIPAFTSASTAAAIGVDTDSAFFEVG